MIVTLKPCPFRICCAWSAVSPMTDGTCSSVLEALKLRIPVLATDNGTRPKGTAVWQDGDLSAMLALMENVVNKRAMFVANLPEIELEDNAKRLADSIEMIALHNVSETAGGVGAGRTA